MKHLLLSTAVLLFLHHVPVTAQTRDDVFVTQTSDPADCSGNTGQLDLFFSEALQLSQNARAALDAYDEDPTTRRTVATYFGLEPNKDQTNAIDVAALDTIDEWFGDVINFLNGQAAINPKPKIYCDDTYLVQKALQDVAQDESGYDLLVPAPDGTYELVVIQQQYADQLKPRTLANGQTYQPYPWWNTDLHIYEFTPLWTPATSFCGVNTHYGSTTTDTEPDIVTFCPRTFTTTNYAAKLGSRKAVAGDPIARVMSRSATFLHEMFHLVEGAAHTFDYCNTVAECIHQSANGNGAQARTSPECLTMFAEAMWLAKNQEFSFETGRAQAIEGGVKF